MWMRARWIRVVIGLASVATVLGACSKSSSPTGTPTTRSTQAPAPTASGSSSAPAGALSLQQGAGGFVFTPAKLTVKKGQTITVANVGSVPHTFTITGKGIDVVNNAGQSQSVTIDLAPGTYPFICRFHVSLGMKGTLIVKA